MLDSLYDALSLSCKFVCLKAWKFRNSFLCQSSKPLLELCEMNPWELSLLWISCWFIFWGDAGLSVCQSFCLCPQNRCFCIIYLKLHSMLPSCWWGLPCRFWISEDVALLNKDLTFAFVFTMKFMESLGCRDVKLQSLWRINLFLVSWDFSSNHSLFPTVQNYSPPGVYALTHISQGTKDTWDLCNRWNCHLD